VVVTRRFALAVAVLGIGLALLATPALARRPGVAPTASTAGPAAAMPIQHAVVIYQENHSFDNVLGVLCVKDNRCDGTTTGVRHDGTSMQLGRTPDIVPNVSHSTASQQRAVDGGKMDGFDLINGCQPAKNYRCFSQYEPEQIPNLTTLARRFALSDRTFEMNRVLSFGAHLELVSVDLDGFDGSIPQPVSYAPKGKGWGCQSNRVTGWQASNTAPIQQVPSCVPLRGGTGTFWDTHGPNGHPQTSPVAHVDNLFDTMDANDVSWKVYASSKSFDPCSYFATCESTVQYKNVVSTTAILKDASDGALPAVSLVLPTGPNVNTSQHNQDSMKAGDGWIGRVVTSLEKGPDWDSTAIFITYDDCGCFYDHVPPPDSTMGIRLPMVIVSPFAKAGFTDSTPVSFVGMIAFIEHVFHLPPVDSRDAKSYDYMNSFDFSQQPLPPAPMVGEHLPESEVEYLNTHPWDDDDDPT
jgi:phospholipase C